jgi:hypothetical protein
MPSSLPVLLLLLLLMLMMKELQTLFFTYELNA